MIRSGEDFLKVGVIGWGRTARLLHAPAIKANSKQFRIQAAADTNKQARADATAQGYAAYADYREMLDKEALDLVCVLTMSSQHCEVACECLDAGVSVLVTKPWALDENEARKMLSAADRSPGKLLPWLPSRWGCDFRRIQAILDSGKIGKVFAIKRSYHGWSRRDDWQTEIRHGGGILLNWGPHLIDQPVQLAGSPAQTVFGVLKHLVNPNDAEDVFFATIHTENGVYIQSEWSFAPFDPPNWIVQGTRGAIVVKDKNLTVYHGELAYSPDPTRPVRSAVESEKETLSGEVFGDAAEIYSHVADVLSGKEVYAVPLQDALYLTQLLDRVRESHECGHSLRIDKAGHPEGLHKERSGHHRANSIPCKP